jgi:glycosyltransferase involved in cell wall biosynthesis
VKISIITVSYNSEKYLEETIRSVANQDYADLEYIIIDGGSTDSTIDIIKRNSEKVSFFLSEKDEGIYDAMNKGISHATGDIIGFLNSDDILFDNSVISKITKAFSEVSVGIVYGNVKIGSENDLSKIIRNYSSKGFRPAHFRFGIMPPHPAIYIRKLLYDRLGNFQMGYIVASDFDLILRFFLKGNMEAKHIDEDIVLMRDGGVSNRGFYKSKRIITREVFRACSVNKLKTNYVLLNLRFLMKLKQLLIR